MTYRPHPAAQAAAATAEQPTPGTCGRALSTGQPCPDHSTAPAVGDRYVSRTDPDRTVTVTRVWTADDGHTAVAFEWRDGQPGICGSACPLNVFHRAYWSATAPDVLAEIAAERARQDAKFGEQNHPDGTGNKSQQDYAEQARKWCEAAFGSGYGTWADVLAEEVAEVNAERGPAKLRAELVQVAAVAVAWIEAIGRRTVPATDE